MLPPTLWKLHFLIDYFATTLALIRTKYPQKSISIDDDDDEEEYIDVDGMVKALRSKGEDISIIVCNNQPYMDPEVLEELAAHLLANKNIRHLSLVNCNFTDSVVEVSKLILFLYR